jgi:FAD:protein FMN transferase
MGRKKTRREFLQMLPASGDRMPAWNVASPQNGPSGLFPNSNALMTRLSCRAMATRFEIRFLNAVPSAAGPREHDSQLAMEALESLESLEEQMSLFRPASEINRVNLLAADKPVEIDPGMFRLLRLAKDVWQDTEGAFDITATPLWQAWGFDSRSGMAPSDEQIAVAMSKVGFQFVSLDETCNTVYFDRQGIKLNLGAVGKGYALDVCAAKLDAGGMENFLIHGGQSSIIARGADLTQNADFRDPASHFWIVGIPHPWQPSRRIAEINLRNRAIGTSGSQFQSFRHKGKQYGHIIDPRTGRPAEGVLSATAVAPSAALADALSTAFYVMGVEKSLAYSQAHPDIAAVLLTHSGRGEDVEIHCCGLDDDDILLQGAFGH